MSYKFIERGINTNTSSLGAAVVSLVKMILFAPYYLVLNVSMKVVYLQEDQIRVWLNAAIGFACGTGVLYTVLGVLLKQDYWIQGEFPIVAPFLSALLLLGLKTLFNKKFKPMIQDVIGLLATENRLSDEEDTIAGVRGSLSQQGLVEEEDDEQSAFYQAAKSPKTKATTTMKDLSGEFELSCDLIPPEFNTLT